MRLLTALALMVMLVASCGKLPGLLGGTNVAANTQLGKTNTQTVGKTVVNEQTLFRPSAGEITQTADTTSLKADTVDTVVLNSGIPISWVIGLVLWTLLLWQAPRPPEIAAWVASGFGLRKRVPP